MSQTVNYGNLADLPDNDFVVDGMYEVEVDKVEAGVSAKKGTPFHKLYLRVVDGPDQPMPSGETYPALGTMIFYSLYDPTDSMAPRGKLMCLKSIKKAMDGFGVAPDSNGDFDWDAFVGTRAIIQTKQKKDLVTGYESLDIVKVRSL